jgi:hypothetical protein
MNDDLYSDDVSRRYQATLSAGNLVMPTSWPIGCQGAANGFLVLIGPSMGGAGRGQRAQLGGANRPVSEPRRIGPEVMSFKWGDSRHVRWTRLCAEMLGAEKYVPALTSLLNLDWRHSTSEKNVPEQDMLNGFTQCVWPLLAEVRPRLVCPLTNRVWDIVLRQAEKHRVPFEPCPIGLPRAPVFVTLPGSESVTMLIKPHTHPSRALSYAQIAELGKACRWFLDRGVA